MGERCSENPTKNQTMQDQDLVEEACENRVLALENDPPAEKERKCHGRRDRDIIPNNSFKL